MFPDQVKEMMQEVEIFKNRFEFTYNRKLHIIIADKNSKSKIDNYSVQWKDEIDALGNHKITNKLEELQGIVLRAMHKVNPDLRNIDSMVITTRRREVLVWIQAFTHIARRIGFTTTKIGEFIGRDHSTIVHQTKATSDMLFTKEELFMQAYNAIINEIRDYVGIISTDTEGEDDSKSVLNSLRNKEESGITIT